MVKTGPKRKACRKKPRRVYAPLTDANILVLILSGEIVVDVENGLAWREDKGLLRRTKLKARSCHRNYLHVYIYWKGKRKSIALHKLVWMAANRQLVPDGYHIDHGAEGKAVNGIHNLFPKLRQEHEWYHEWKRAYQGKFATYDEFREWKKQQPVEPEQEFD